MRKELQRGGSAAQAADMLLAQALKKRTDDNVSIVVILLGENGQHATATKT